jgi:hypothetical protein
MIDFLLGAIAMSAATAGLIFLRYFHRTRDRFFLFFAAAFWIEALGRILFVRYHYFDDSSTAGYVLRLVTYSLILIAILDKNLPRRRKP